SSATAVKAPPIPYARTPTMSACAKGAAATKTASAAAADKASRLRAPLQRFFMMIIDLQMFEVADRELLDGCSYLPTTGSGGPACAAPPRDISHSFSYGS